MKEGSILFATTNSGKLVEVRQIAEEFGISIVGLADVESLRGKAPQVDETADTYEGNALLKAQSYAQWSGMSAIADDTGLEVAALGGRPGVKSARYAGDKASGSDNCRKLLSEMEGQVLRDARFVCVLALAAPESAPITVRDTLSGEISSKPSGTGGFGYDSLFYLPALAMTLAEAKAGGIAVQTHRIGALRSLFQRMRER